VRSSLPLNPKREFRLSGNKRDSVRNQLPDLSLGTQARRRELQKLSNPTGAV
jgi:hypothetical protein